MDFTVVFNEPVLVTGTPRIALTLTSGTVYATYLSGSDSDTLVFRHTVAGGDADADGIVVGSPLQLNGGTIKERSGIAISVLTFTPPTTTGITFN